MPLRHNSVDLLVESCKDDCNINSCSEYEIQDDTVNNSGT